MDQITSLDGTYLLPFKEIKKINSQQYKGPTLKWYNTIEEKHTVSTHNKRLLTPLSHSSIQPLRQDFPKISNNN
jgi:hypothetical protein